MKFILKKRNYLFLFLILLFILLFCYTHNFLFSNHHLKLADPSYLADSFDFPVGKPDAQGYYIAQKFKKNNHLGEDWNGIGGGNTDLGDPIYAIGNGYVKFARNLLFGWGKTIRIIHILPNGNRIESFYAHCDIMNVTKGMWVQKGQKIGTIGTGNGTYPAHLHFEIRDDISMGIGSGYSKKTIGYLDPTEFIKNNRKFKH